MTIPCVVSSHLNCGKEVQTLSVLSVGSLIQVGSMLAVSATSGVLLVKITQCRIEFGQMGYVGSK